MKRFEDLEARERKQVLAELHRLRCGFLEYVALDLFCAGIRTLEDIHEKLKERPSGGPESRIVG